MYDRILRKALHTPWAIEPTYAAIVQDLLGFRAAGGRLTEAEIVARIETHTGEKFAGARQAPAPGGNIAVIPVYGVIAHRAFEASSGATSTEYLGAQLRRVMAEPSIGTVVFDVSSPGGTIEGVPELAAAIATARKSKYVVAASNALMASAAYWIGSQAHEIVVTPSGGVGSVGVFTLTEDHSEQLAKAGVKINAISAGDFKLEGAPWAPLSDEARAYLQGQVDDAYAQFVGAVAKGRGTTAADVKKRYGQGRCLDAAAALAAGMVDRIETFDQTIARLQKASAGASSSRGSAQLRRALAASDLSLDEAGNAVTARILARLEADLVGDAAADADAIAIAQALADL
jgi:capsid assembly protease